MERKEGKWGSDEVVTSTFFLACHSNNERQEWWGDSHMKRSGILVGEFELNPRKEFGRGSSFI